MKRGRALAMVILAGLAASAGGCANEQGSASAFSTNREAGLVPAPGRQRGLMVAGDSLGRAVFEGSTPAMASVPDRE